MSTSKKSSASKAVTSIFQMATMSEQKTAKWELVPGSNLYFSDKEVASIIEAVIIECTSKKDASKYKKLKVTSTLYKDQAAWLDVDNYTAKRFVHMDQVDPACLVAYQLKSKEDGRVINRVRVNPVACQE